MFEETDSNTTYHSFKIYLCKIPKHKPGFCLSLFCGSAVNFCTIGVLLLCTVLLYGSAECIKFNVACAM